MSQNCYEHKEKGITLIIGSLSFNSIKGKQPTKLLIATYTIKEASNIRIFPIQLSDITHKVNSLKLTAELSKLDYVQNKSSWFIHNFKFAKIGINPLCQKTTKNFGFGCHTSPVYIHDQNAWLFLILINSYATLQITSYCTEVCIHQ